MFKDEKPPNDKHSFGGLWTLNKLEILEKYLAAFNNALSRQSFKRIYIDAFAGTGRCDITVAGKKTKVDGSARRALRANPPFHKFVFIEMRAKRMAALKSLQDEYPDKDIEIIHDDANTALKALCDKYDWQSTRAVLFLDPYGMHVDWTTLQVIARTGAIDVWYLFPYSALYRQAAINADAMNADKEDAVTRILGTNEWRQVFYASPRHGDLFGHISSDTREANHHDMLKYVSKRLRVQFPAVSEPKVFYRAGSSKNPSGAPLFALYFAASNPKPNAHGLALKIAKSVLKTL